MPDKNDIFLAVPENDFWYLLISNIKALPNRFQSKMMIIFFNAWITDANLLILFYFFLQVRQYTIAKIRKGIREELPTRLICKNDAAH